MTALDRYAKLEAEGTYFDGTGSQGREVILSFGARTLIVGTFQDVPVTHWPLASLRAVEKTDTGGVWLAPDLTSPERVIVHDAEMIEAIEEVCPDLYKKPLQTRSPRRMMRWIGVAAVAGLLTFITFAPGLGDPLAGSIDAAQARTLGDAALGAIGTALPDRDTRPALCTAPEGAVALNRLLDRLAPEAVRPDLRVSIIDDPLIHATALPGGRLLVFRGMLEAARTPDEIAGMLALLTAHAGRGDPVRQAYYAAGTFDRMRLVFGASLNAATVAAATTAALAAPYEPDAEQAARAEAAALLSTAGLPAPPFAAFLARIEADPLARALFGKFPGLGAWAASAGAPASAPYRAALPDRDWIALGNICDVVQPIRLTY